MLSTNDNPFNPWTQWDDWYAWDEEHGYHTCSYLARFVNTLSDVDDETNDTLTNIAINSILEQNITGNYIYVPDPDANKEN